MFNANRWLVAASFVVLGGCAAPVATATEAEGLDETLKPISVLKAVAVQAPVKQACILPLGWRAKNAAFDPGVTPALATFVNPLLTGEHPLTIAPVQTSAATWSMRVSGTLSLSSVEYFPPDHMPTPVSMSLDPSGIASIGAAQVSWFEIIDAKLEHVWIPMRNVVVSASFDNGCGMINSAVLDALIDDGSISIATASGDMTLGEMFDTTTITPWHVRVTFDGDEVAVLP